MRKEHIALLRRLAGQRLDDQRQAVAARQGAVTALSAALHGLEVEVTQQSALALSDARRLPTLWGYLGAERQRRQRLGTELDVADQEREREVERARELFLECRRLDHLAAQALAREQAARSRRETAFLDWLAQCRHGAALAHGAGAPGGDPFADADPSAGRIADRTNAQGSRPASTPAGDASGTP